MEKKIMFLIMLTLMLLIPMFSGCLDIFESPVVTLQYYPTLKGYRLTGAYYIQFCDAKNFSFVYDTETHENWSDYKYQIPAKTFLQQPHVFQVVLISGEDYTPGVKYYYKFVAYCYNLSYIFKDLEDGWYDGSNMEFYVGN